MICIGAVFKFICLKHEKNARINRCGHFVVALRNALYARLAASQLYALYEQLAALQFNDGHEAATPSKEPQNP